MIPVMRTAPPADHIVMGASLVNRAAIRLRRRQLASLAMILGVVLLARVVDLRMLFGPRVDLSLAAWAPVAAIGCVACLITIYLVRPAMDAFRAAEASDENARFGERIRLASSVAEEGLWTYDSSENALWTSPQARTLLHADDASEHADMSIATLLLRVHPDDRSLVMATMNACASVDRIHEVDCRVRIGADEWRRVRIRARATFVEGRAVAFHGAVAATPVMTPALRRTA